ncbi:outer membrane lipoprotein carrier protein LolA [candidate division KSB1 bacterium]
MVYKNIRIGLVFALIVFINNNVSGEDANDIISKVQKKYKSAKDIIIKFDREFIFSLSKNRNIISGKIFIMGDDYLKYETEDQVFITDGEYVWNYSSTTNQTIIDFYKSDEDEVLPKELLFNFNKKYKSKLLGRENIEGTNCYVLEAVPKEENLEIKSLKVWIDSKKWITKRIEYLNLNDNIIVYSILDVKFDNELQEKFFEFKFPQGAEVIDLTGKLY